MEMEEEFKVIDNYLMIRMPDEIDHHHSVDISKEADRYIMVAADRWTGFAADYGP